MTQRILAPVSLALLVCPSLVTAQSTVRVSVDSHGLPAENASFGASISGDGRFVAFASASSQLVPGDTNGFTDVFVHDRSTGVTVRASVSTSGAQADADCIGQFMSEDGRFVGFRTSAMTLVSGDTNGVSDVFVRDLVLGTTERVSIATNGNQGDGDSYYGSLSADGRFVLFTSQSMNLVPGDTNLGLDAFVRDRVTGVTKRVSVDSTGVQSEAFSFSVSGTISGDGRFATFESSASNLVAGDVNHAVDVFLHDMITGNTTRVSVGSTGLDANASSEYPCISSDGRFVAFTSEASNLVPGDTNGHDDVFVKDLVAGTTTRASLGAFGVEGNGDSYTYYAHTTISGHGRFVVFQSEASNLTASADANNESDVFVRDLLLGTTNRVSVSSSGQPTVGSSIRGALSTSGRFIAFESDDAGLVAGDVNNARDLFVRDVRSTCSPIESYCVGKTNSHGCVPALGSSGEPSAGNTGGFAITALNEVAGSSGSFVWSLAPATIPFAGGTLCVHGPITRTLAHGAAVHASTDPAGACIGSFVFDFDPTYIQAHALTPGTTVYGQFVSRDAGFAAPNNVALSDAIRFTICP